MTGPGLDQLLRLQPGDAIGPYRIVREIAAGGMATVYLAQDLKHERQVAVKVLGPVLAAVLGAERFAQEIMTTARLQHPHILPLLDSGQAGGLPYYVMPYIEGETLRERLNRETQLGVEEAVQIAAEVADALDYAHRKGVVHRDIKPENILLHDGRPLVADFGIAVAVRAAADGRTTEAGLLLGTPLYMSPEQATAEKDLTSRSDIYSLGCVLYEMLAGGPPHAGATTQEVIRKIVTDEPRPVSEVRRSVPHNVAAATAKSLEKLPADRFASARAFARALEDPHFTTPVTRVDPRFGRPYGKGARPNPWVLAVVVVGVLLGAWGWLRDLDRNAEREVVEFYLDPPGPEMYFGERLALSPDGQRLVAEILTPDGWVLYQRTRDSRGWRVIPGTGGASTPFFSPDGAWMAYYSSPERALKKLPAAGGPPQTITQAAWVGGASWGADGTVVFQTQEDPSSNRPPALYSVSAGGGEPVLLLESDSLLRPILGSPHWLEGSDALLFTSGIAPPYVCAYSAGSGRRARLVPGVSPKASGDDLLTWATLDGSLVAQPFDPAALELRGPPTQVAEGVSVRGMYALYTVSSDGSIAYQAASERESHLLVVERDGETQRVYSPGIGSSMAAPRFSPTGDRVAFIRDGDVWVYSISQGAARRLTFSPGSANDPAWTNDGRYVGYSFSSGDGEATPVGLYRIAADGTGEAERIAAGASDLWELEFAPGDSVAIAFSVNNLYRVPVGADATPERLMETAAYLAHGTLSPDGRWLAYRSNESGTNEVYARSYPAMGPAAVISTGGGDSPAWSADGNEIFYWGGGRMNVASVRVIGDRLSVVDRTELFDAGPFQAEWNRSFDVHPDGRSFVIVSRPSTRVVWRTGALRPEP